MEQGQSWFLVAIAGSLQGQEMPLTEKRLTVGREETNGLVLLDDNVSRRHLELHIQDARVILTDLGSRNGTFINNQKITGTLVLNHGDRLALGSHLLEVQGRALPSRGFDDDIGALAFEPDDDKTVVHSLGSQTDWMPPGAPGRRPPHQAQPVEEEKTFSPGGVPDFAPALHGSAPREATLKVPPDAGAPLLEGREIQPPRGAALHPPAHLSPADLGATSYRRPAHVNAEPEMGFSTPDLPPMEPEPQAEVQETEQPKETIEEVRARNRTIFVGGAAIILMAMMGVLIVVVSQGGPGAAEAEPPRRHQQAAAALTSDMEQGGDDSISALLSGEGGTSLVVGPQAYKLSPEEANMAPTERMALAEETFDQAVSLAESEKFKEALREFNHALALDGTCDICMIRANKVAQDIRQRIEKYNSDGLRYFQALKYEKAERSWERALLLLDDPQSPVGIKIQTKMAEARQQQARQSYR